MLQRPAVSLKRRAFTRQLDPPALVVAGQRLARPSRDHHLWGMDIKKTGAIVFMTSMVFNVSADTLADVIGVEYDPETFTMERTATGSTSLSSAGDVFRVQNTVLGDVYAARPEQRGGVTDVSSGSSRR